MKIKLFLLCLVIFSSFAFSQTKRNSLNVNVGFIRNFVLSDDGSFYAPYFELGYSRTIFAGYCAIQFHIGYWNDFANPDSRSDGAFYSYVFGTTFSVSPNFIYSKMNLPFKIFGGISYHFNNFKEIKFEGPMPIQAFHSGSNYDMLVYLDLGIEAEIKLSHKFELRPKLANYSLLENGKLVYPLNRIAGEIGFIYSY